MKISAFEIKIGNLIEHQHRLWRILKKSHVKPGKGGAFVQVEMKEHGTGTKLNERFRSEDKIEKAHVEPRQMQFLYQESDSYNFMDNITFEQMTLSAEDLEAQSGYLLPSMNVQINFYNDTAIGVELPQSVALEVSDTETTIKGQTAASSAKPAILETGIRVMVPPFVNIGDRVKINTDTGEYIERAD